MNFHPIWPVIYARSNFKFDQHEILVKLGWNSLRLIVCLPGRIGYHLYGLHPIWAVFHARSNWVSSQSMDLLPIRPVEFDRAWNTAQNGCKFTEINCLPAWSNWISFQWIYSHFEQYFMPGQIWPGMKYCSIWVEIHGFTPNLSSISGLVELGIILVNLLPFWAVFLARSNWE